MGTLRVISHSDEACLDRQEAGRLLGDVLAAGRENVQVSVVVLGIPRGGLLVAREIGRRLGAELDIALARKLGAPGNPELAIGAVAEDGHCFLDEELTRWTGADERYIQQEKARQIQEISRRLSRFRQARPKVSLQGKEVIITDDGAATGATMQAALWCARAEAPAKLVAALPVAPPDTLQRFATAADEVVCLRAPSFFQAVGQFYRDFEQTDDEEVLEILRQQMERKGA